MIDGEKQHRQLAILVRRAQEGDRAAFEKLYAATAQAQYFTMVGKVGADAAADLLQELYAIVWKNIDNIHPDAIIGYLNATTRHLCLRHIDRRSSPHAPVPYSDEYLEDTQTGHEPLFGAASTADPAIGASDRDQAAQLAAALHSELDDQEREAVMLRYYQRLKLADVAAALGVSQATVKRVIARALDKLRAKLGFLPMGAALSQAMASAVESSHAPGAALRAGHARPATSVAERAVAGAAMAAAVALAFVGFAAVNPRPEAVISEEPLPAAFPEAEASRNADTQGPQLLETIVEGTTTILRIEDASGVASVACIAEDGTVFAPETTAEATGADAADTAERTGSTGDTDAGADAGAPGADAANTRAPHSPSPTVSEWRFSLPAGTYELRATDVRGNTSTGTITVNLPEDPFAALD